MPTPGQLRELAGAADEHEAARACDEAFALIRRYIKRHGVERRDYARWENPEQPMNGPLQIVKPPAIPAQIEATLVAIGGTLADGLERVAETAPKDTHWLRRDFDAAYMRQEGR